MYDEDMPATYDNINYYTSEIAFYLKECDKLENCLRDYIQKKEDKKEIEAMNDSLVFYREIVRKYTEKLERAVCHIKHFGPEGTGTPYTVVDLDNDCIGYINGKAIYRTCLYELFYEETESRFAFYGLPCDDLSLLTPFTSLSENEQRQILSILNSKSELREWIAKYKRIQKIRKKLKMKNTEKIEITYTLQGDYYLPNLILPEQPKVKLGHYADLRCDFLENHYEIIYYDLLTDCKLVEHLAQIEQEALELEETLTRQMMEAQGVTEQLKAEDQMEWVGRMNNIRNSVREIVLKEVIYRI